MKRISMFIADFDRTITDSSLRVDKDCLAEISALRDRGVHTMLVTGRKRAFVDHFLAGHPDVFDSAVCENGCLVLLKGAWEKTATFAHRGEIIRRIEDAGIVFDRGDCIVSTEALSSQEVKSLLVGIHGWHAVVNVDSVMILPEGVDKGSGIAYVQARNGRSREETAAIGDGENDTVMREFCSVLGAPASAVEDMKRVANFVSDRGYSEGTLDFVRHLIAMDMLPDGVQGYSKERAHREK